VKLAIPFRSNHVQGLIADAFLRLKHKADKSNKKFLLVIIVEHLTQRAENLIRHYTNSHTPDLNWLVIANDTYLARIPDLLCEQERSAHFEGSLDTTLIRQSPEPKTTPFAATMQWLLKSLLLPGISEKYWSGPSEPPLTLTELAKRTEVSLPYVSLLAKSLVRSGHLAKRKGRLHLTGIETLLTDWSKAPRPDKNVYAVESIYPDTSTRSSISRIFENIRTSTNNHAYAISSHAACELHGVSVSTANTLWLYCNMPVAICLRELDLQIAVAPRNPIAKVIETRATHSIFRPRVIKEGLPVCDILQVYLDVSSSRTRGEEQAQAILDRILRPHFKGIK
jgi:hypothetical protein